ncbi:hypothetical protein HMPREF1544_09349 [Mucor circinelloides 1006PhL]|uniref:Uncharacterized protein n=1 Tax=Mucor circinelloides f. circinelloides (strain 1006PhL) TaxID=1220926 RepID=S2JVR1_MUCC1|nr:hypothetical protein HMPREF1544_09349 [Mucor circinelloides 1006PhL]
MAHNKNLGCLACNLDSETESKLSNHNYDTHVGSVQATFDDGKITHAQRNATNINDVLRDQPVGNWELPLENSESSINSPTASQSNTLNHIIKTSPFYKHLSDTKYVELSKSTVSMISKDWIQFPQLRYAIPQLFSGAVIIDEYAALLVNGLEPYGRLRIVEAHFERRTKSTLSQPSFPKKETKYGWTTTVAVEDGNTTKLKIGLLTCNLLITSSLRIDNHAATTNGAIELGSNTDIFFS